MAIGSRLFCLPIVLDCHQRYGGRFVPIAALTAIIAPELLVHQGQLVIGPNNLRLIAGIIATVVAWRTRNVLWTIVIGMGTLWLLQVYLAH